MMRSAIQRRAIHCYACKSTFKIPTPSTRAKEPIVCPNCGVPQQSASRLQMRDHTEETNELSPSSTGTDSLSNAQDEPYSSISDIRIDAGHTDVGGSADGLEDELKLSPAISVSASLENPGGSGPKTRSSVMEELEQLASVEEVSPAVRSHPRRSSFSSRGELNDDAIEQELADAMNRFGRYPSRRHYPTLEAMQRLYKVFGYAAVAIVFPYLAARLVWTIYKADESVVVDVITFSEWAIPTIFATVGIVGTLFAAAEGIRLAIDLQDNTLRLANAAKQNRP